MRSIFAGSSSRSNSWLRAVDSAGSHLDPPGRVILLPEAAGTFSPDAASRINTLNASSRTTIGDAGGGDTAILLTAAGQNFNSPTLLVLNNQADSAVTSVARIPAVPCSSSTRREQQ